MIDSLLAWQDGDEEYVQLALELFRFLDEPASPSGGGAGPSRQPGHRHDTQPAFAANVAEKSLRVKRGLLTTLAVGLAVGPITTATAAAAAQAAATAGRKV